MHTEEYCKTLDALDRVQAIRAIHQAYLQLMALNDSIRTAGAEMDNVPALGALYDCLATAGHIGFSREEFQKKEHRQ